MNLRQLELIRALIRCGTTVGAARDLGLSQPAVSNALKSLESQLGFALFDRVNNRLFPTEAARIIHDESDPIFDLHHALQLRVRNLREDRTKILRIAATPPVAQGIIPGALGRFRRQHPKVRVMLEVMTMTAIIDALEKGAVELAIVLGTAGHEYLSSEVFFSRSLVCVFHKSSPLAGKSVITPEDLTSCPMIRLGEINRLRLAVDKAFAAAGIDDGFNAAVEVRYANVACSIAEAGGGVAIVDQLTACLGGFRDLEVRPFRPEIMISAFAMQSSHRPLSKLAERFLRDVRLTTDEVCARLQSRAGPA